jgi:hypothetical protein
MSTDFLGPVLLCHQFHQVERNSEKLMKWEGWGGRILCTEFEILFIESFFLRVVPCDERK